MKKHVSTLNLAPSTKCISTMKRKMFFNGAFIGLPGKYQILPKRQMAKGILAICFRELTPTFREPRHFRGLPQ